MLISGHNAALSLSHVLCSPTTVPGSTSHRRLFFSAIFSDPSLTAVSWLSVSVPLPRFDCRIEYIATVSAGDALLLEASLIRQHQPPFNVLLKDDKRTCEKNVDRCRCCCCTPM